MRPLLALLALGLIAVGPAALIAPDLAAGAFGIPVDARSAGAYLLAAATRDVALGVWLLALLALKAEGRILAVSVLAIALVAAGDAANLVVNTGGRVTPPLVVHVGSLVVLVALGRWLWGTGRD